MHVALFPADSYGCGHYRMHLPAEHAGVETTIHDRAKLRTSNDLARRAVLLHEVDVDGADVAVFQRPLDHRLVPVIEQLKRQGVATVVELDDDLSALDPYHSAWTGMHPRTSPLSNWNHLKAACRAADLVTVSTPALAKRFAGHGRVVVVPNCVEERLLSVYGEWLAAFGWAGVVGTHPRDLRVPGDAVRHLVDDGLAFGVVGPSDGIEGAFGIEEFASTGWLDLDSYYNAVAGLGVGLVPLANSAFNHSKSALKGIEYAALGVPFVASPLPEYVRLSDLGAGRLATKPKRWETEIRALLDDDEASARGREVVRDHFLIDREGYRWAEAWERAVQNRHGRRTVTA